MLPKLPDNFHYTQFSLHLLSQIITELETLAKPREKYELRLISGHLGTFYNLTLTYAFVMEICKLMEPRVKGGNHYASLEKLNYKVQSLIGKSFSDAFGSNNDRLLELRKGPFFRMIKEELRDVRFAHMDKDKTDLAHIYNIKALTDEQLTEARKFNDALNEIHNVCGSAYGIHFHNNTDTRTENIIKYYGKYWRYYDENGRSSSLI
jgi:hypothetical protein